MRHCDINLTMSRYTHIFRGQESEAVESLPDLSFTGGQSQRTTGTDGAKAETGESAYKPAHKKLAKNADFHGESVSPVVPGQEGRISGTAQNSQDSKPLQLAKLGTKKTPCHQLTRDKN